jgi:hypothetical protein
MPDVATRFFDALFDRVADGLKTTADIQKALLNAIDNPATARTLERGLEVALPYFAVPGRRAPFNRSFSGERKLAWSEYDFAEVRAIRKVCGATVNDVVLAVLGGALSRYYEAHGQDTEGHIARILTPVNVRREDEQGSLGNRISMLLVEVPLGMRNPVERLDVIRERTARLKRDHVGDGIGMVADTLGALPPMSGDPLPADADRLGDGRRLRRDELQPEALLLPDGGRPGHPGRRPSGGLPDRGLRGAEGSGWSGAQRATCDRGAAGGTAAAETGCGAGE